jgi:peptidoglycan hydrolase CwlO-like protein
MNDTLILLISNALTAVASFFIGKRKTDAETDNMVLKNLELSINLYKQIIDDLKKEIHDLNLQVQTLEKKVEELMTENKKLKRHNGL